MYKYPRKSKTIRLHLAAIEMITALINKRAETFPADWEKNGIGEIVEHALSAFIEREFESMAKYKATLSINKKDILSDYLNVGE